MSRLEGFLSAYQQNRKVTVLTCYDFQMAQILESSGVDLLLVGDSLGMVFQGLETTQGVTLEQMAYHTRAVRKGAPRTPIVTDLPFGTYSSDKQALESSKALLEAGADAVKFEGYQEGLARALVNAGIPVMGHLGLLPQTIHNFKVQGKEEEEAEKMLQDAQALEKEGAFSIVLECIPRSLAQKITTSLKIPTIGIGAGPDTSGQVLVINDLLGWGTQKKAKFVPVRFQIRSLVTDQIRFFVQSIVDGQYPSDEESYH